MTSYDAGDRVTEVRRRGETALEDLVTTYEYTPLGDLARTILPRGNVIENLYDPAGRLVEVHRKPDRFTPGERTVFTLDAMGHRIREEQQRWDGAQWIVDSSTGYEYSSRCHLDKVLHPDGTVTEYAYDCDGNLEKIWDPNHPSVSQTAPPTQRYLYDALDRMSEMRQPWAAGGEVVTKYFYDVQDHLIRVVDAEGNVTDYLYFDRDLLTEQISEVSGMTNYRYDEHGALVEETDARGVTTRRTLDALDRVRFVDSEDDPLDTAYTYDDPLTAFSQGRLTAIDRASRTVRYEYDRFGRLTTDGELRWAFGLASHGQVCC